MKIPVGPGSPAGGDRRSAAGRGARRRRAVVAGLVALTWSSSSRPARFAAAAAGLSVVASSCSRTEFVTVEGYQNRIGETALLEGQARRPR